MGGLLVKYSEPDEQCHDLHLMTTENISTVQPSDWLMTFHAVAYIFCCKRNMHFISWLICLKQYSVRLTANYVDIMTGSQCYFKTN